MACSSVYSSGESQLARDLTRSDLACSDMTRGDLTPLRNSRDGPARSNGTVPYRLPSDGHEAIRFLQAEHEVVLSGLHQQMQELQQRCDDMQFELHLRHIASNDLDTWKTKVAEVQAQLDSKEKRIATLEEALEHQRLEAEEERDQLRWRLLESKQQAAAGEERINDLKAEVARLRSQVHDLRVYNNALRTGGSRPSSRASVSSRGVRSVSTSSSTGGAPPTSSTSQLGPRPLSRSSYASLDSLDSGPRSLGSEDGDAAGEGAGGGAGGVMGWRGARLGAAGISARSRQGRAVRGNASPPPPRNSALSLPPALGTSHSSLSHGDSASASRSRNVTLPPISLNQSVTRAQIRRQLRLQSAPNLDSRSMAIDRSHRSTAYRDPA
ncbi:uncharacterized protein LOC143028173 [Oratosquilla oratoria]|uniref:uncharacterized protein LOC143028173 n=1 Tax=Oratosquilla oratoria TaxID=337810 RepID=UPI003F76F20E